jgi:hypothetical protein
MTVLRYSTLIILLVFCNALATASCLAAPIELQTIALTGRPVSGLPAGVTFSRLWDVRLSNSGQVAFQGSISVGQHKQSDPQMIWQSRLGGTLSPVVQTASSWLTTEVATAFSSIDLLSMNEADAVLFGSSIGDPYANKYLMQSTVGLNLQEIMRRDGAAPQVAPHAQFLGMNEPISRGEHVLVDAATVEYDTALIVDYNPKVVAGLWGYSEGQLDLLVRTGMQAPGTPLGTTLYNVITHSLNSQGSIAFMGHLIGFDVEQDNHAIFMKHQKGDPGLVAREGQQITHSTGEIKIHDFDYYSPLPFNDQGQLAFKALIGVSGSQRARQSIWTGTSSDDLRLVVASEDPAPGTPPGVYFKDFWGLSLNDAGQLAFTASLRDSGGDIEHPAGIWSTNPQGQLELVIRSGGTMPGGGILSSCDGMVITDRGQLAFGGSVDYPGQEREYAIWGQDKHGVLQRLVSLGLEIDVEPGPGVDHRTVEDFTLLGSSNSGGNWETTFNDRGQFAFIAWFTDGTEGVFLSNQIAIPEPSTAALMIISMLLAQPRSRESTNRIAACRALASPARYMATPPQVWAQVVCCVIHNTFSVPVAWQQTRIASPRHLAGTTKRTANS